MAALQEVFPCQVFLLQGYPRPGEHFQTQTGYRISTHHSSLELPSENIYITTTTKRWRKRSLCLISLLGSCLRKRGCQGSAGRPVCMELRYACERQSLKNDTNPKRRSVPSRRSEGQTRAREQEELVRCQVPRLPPCPGSTARDPPDFRQSCDALTDSCSQEMHRRVLFQLCAAATWTRSPATALPQAPQRINGQGGWKRSALCESHPLHLPKEHWHLLL